MLQHWERSCRSSCLSQYTDTGPTSPSADLITLITPGAWPGSHWSTQFNSSCPVPHHSTPAVKVSGERCAQPTQLHFHTFWRKWQLAFHPLFTTTSAFSKENSAISLEKYVLVFKVFTTATRKLGVKVSGIAGPGKRSTPQARCVLVFLFVCFFVCLFVCFVLFLFLLLFGFCFCFFVFCFFFCFPQLYFWGSPILGEIFAYVTVFLIQPLR